jgi:hypothetical protein
MSFMLNFLQGLFSPIRSLFSRPASSGQGNKNCIIYNNCNPLANPSVRYAAVSDIVADGNWDMQVNVYSATGTSAYTQFVMAVTSSGEVQWSIEGWRLSGPNIFNTCDQPLHKLPGTFLPAGYALSELFETDPASGNITAVTFAVLNGPTVLSRQRVTLDQTLPICDPVPFTWDNAYLFVPVALETNVSGYNNGVAVAFSSARATLSYSAGSGIAWSKEIPSCTETKAQTVETSNQAYDQPTRTGNALTQACHL